MTITNGFANLALDTSVTSVKTSVDTVNSTLTSGLSINSSALPSGAATNATLVLLQALQQEVKDLTENLLIIASAMFERMPRVTANDQAAVSIEAGSVGISAAQTLATVTTVGTVTTVATVTNQTQIGTQDALSVARNQMMAGTQYIYNNLVVS